MSGQDSFIYGNMRYPTSQTDTSCKFNEGVRCTGYDSHGRRLGKDCKICGHNPEVAQRRLDEYCAKHGITIPKSE